MPLSILLVSAIMGTLGSCQAELYVHFEPLPNQKDSWPLARAAVVDTDGLSLQCRMLTSIEDISREKMRLPASMVNVISKEQMDALERSCATEMGRQTITYPGTKWCGPGNNADNYTDLGTLEADKCCRDHDNCDNIEAGETKYNLTNEGPFTVNQCVGEWRNDYNQASLRGFTTKGEKFAD